ncbi:MAG: cobalamin biosynthesis protein CobW [Gloeomargaritaceae cyanobacterium C42_A2020_066]|nr:cobalamin biosynthesis protein CobW [Gloeomargaritaceae cyanobacterium C42_A2020_066]
MHKLPVTVLTGFLGAGKTTLIRHLLVNNGGRRLAVLVNEFGEVGIDGDLLRDCQVCDEEETAAGRVIELTNGCLCCTVQEEFLPAMESLLAYRDRLDGIVIETSGLALPKPLIQAFQWPAVGHAASVDGVVTVVDCAALAEGSPVADRAALERQQQADPNLDHETPLEELFEDQLACADLVVLTKTDLVDAAARQRVEAWLASQLRPGVRLIAAIQGQVVPDVLIGFNAAVEANLAGRPSHHDEEEDHDHDDQIMAVPVVLDQAFELPGLTTALRQILEAWDILRVKGFVAVPHKPLRLVVQGVGQRLTTHFDRPWHPQESRQTRLVFIGRQLDAARITQGLQAVAGTPVA